LVWSERTSNSFIRRSLETGRELAGSHCAAPPTGTLESTAALICLDAAPLIVVLSARSGHSLGARCAVNSLMTELLEGHIRHHVLDPKRKPNAEQTHAADEVIDMVKIYLR